MDCEIVLRPFAMYQASTVAEAAEVLAREGSDAVLYAGGTEILLVLKAGLLRVRSLVDVKRIPGLSAIRADDGRVTLGATVTHRTVEGSAVEIATIRARVRRASPASSARAARAIPSLTDDEAPAMKSDAPAFNKTMSRAGPGCPSRMPANTPARPIWRRSPAARPVAAMSSR